MRKPFIQTLTELAGRDPSVVLLIGDVGFSFLEDFKNRFPEQFINVGIAEQNMMGIASGLSQIGMKPYVYTMANFILLRPLEQLRNDICYSNANVKIFGVKGGASYAFLGYSHNLIEGEEKGMLAFLPNITKHFPETEEETERIMLEEYERNGPAYFSI